MSHTWYFCRACAYHALFAAEPNEKINCPQCHDHGRPELGMIRQEVEWLKKEKEAQL